MTNTPIFNMSTRQTVASDPERPSDTSQYQAFRVPTISVMSITRISEAQARQLADCQLPTFGSERHGVCHRTSSRYLGSEYYELTPLMVTNALPEGHAILRLTQQMTEAHRDFAGASISENGRLCHRDGWDLGSAYRTRNHTIVAQIPHWHQED